VKVLLSSVLVNIIFCKSIQTLMIPTAVLYDISHKIATEHSAEMVDLALRYREKGVVGVDICGGEWLPLHQLHIDAFKVKCCAVAFSYHVKHQYRKLRSLD